MASSRRPDSMSTSMSGGPSRSGDRKRSKSRPSVDGVDVGDPEGVADGRVGGRALGPGSRCPARRQTSAMSHTTRKYPANPSASMTDELVVDLGPGPGHPLGVRVARTAQRARARSAGAGSAARRSPAGPGSPAGAARPGAGRRRTPPQLGGPFDHTGPAGEAAGLLGSRAQAGGRGRRQPPLELGQGARAPAPRPAWWPGGSRAGVA